MKIAVIFASNSGSNYEVGTIVSSVLSRTHEVSLLRARDATLADAEKADFIVLGSASWDVDHQEGSPLKAMQECLARLRMGNLKKKKFAVYGCGDTAYTHFCGAVDHLEEFVHAVGGSFVTKSLRIDGYFFNEAANSQHARAWAERLLDTIKKLW